MVDAIYGLPRCTCPPKPCPACDDAGERRRAGRTGRLPQSPIKRLAYHQQALAQERVRDAELSQTLDQPLDTKTRNALEKARTMVGHSMQRRQGWIAKIVQGMAGKTKGEKR